MAKHEFGIIEDIVYGVEYIYYEPEEYKCISVNDDLIEEMIKSHLEEFKILKTYAHSTTKPITGFNYYGITLIPPESLKSFYNIIANTISDYKSEELELLIEKVTNAMINSKFIIHFGI